MQLSLPGLRLPLLVAALCSSGVAFPAAAQDGDHPMASSGRVSCIDSIPSSAFKRIAVFGSVEFPYPVSRELRMSAELLLQEVATRLQTLLGAKPGYLPEGEPTVTWRSLGLPLFVKAYRGGRITPGVPVGRADAAAAAVLARALDLVLPEASPFLWGADSLRDSVSFQIELAWPTVDSTGKVTPLQLKHTGVPLFSVAHPWERQVWPKADNRGPRYPEAARSAGYEALVKMQFIIDTSGRAVPSSMRDLWPDTLPPLQGEQRRVYEAFVEEVRRVLPAMRFYPAEIGGCKTAQQAVMPFMFSLRR